MASNDNSAVNVEAGLALVTEINHLASVLQKIVVDAVPQTEHDINQSYRLLFAAEKLVGLIGLHSERCAKFLGGGMNDTIGGDLDHWLSDINIKTAEVGHG